MAMKKIQIRVNDELVSVQPLAKFDYRGHRFAIHVSHDSDFTLGITHIESGLAAGKFPRYSGLYVNNYKPIKKTRDTMIADAIATLERVPSKNFDRALERAMSMKIAA